MEISKILFNGSSVSECEIVKELKLKVEQKTEKIIELFLKQANWRVDPSKPRP